MKPIKSSITRKVQISFLLLTVGILVATFVATITGANYLLRDTSIDYTYQLVSEVDDSLSDYQLSMENMAEAILQAEEVRSYMSGDLLSEEACVKIMDFAAATRDDITNIFIMSVAEGEVTILPNKGASALNPYARYKETNWYQSLVLEGKERVLTSSYVQNLINEQYNWVISMAMAVRDDHGEVVGIVLIDLNYSSIERILNNVMPNEQGYIYLLAENKEIVYHPKQQLIFNKVKTENVDLVQNINNDFKQVGNKVYVVLDSGISQWKIIAVLDSTVVYRNTLINTIIFGVIAVIVVILSFIISYVFSNWFTQPIRELAGKMEEVQKGDLKVRVPVKSEDEIGHLSENFNAMTGRIENLVDRIVIEEEEKRQYELNALRSQINPHFLYNTLDSIIWMAECGRNDEVIEMTSALSKMLRASINNQKSGVTLGLEIQNVVNYLKIQKFRYSNKLDYEIHINPRLYARKAAHLVLQPLVENAIYHGIKSKDGVGKIVIRAFEEKGDEQLLVVQVSDDGVGMSQDEIQHILKQDETSSLGIGVANVNRRIALIYGNSYGLTIESELGRGTTVTIRMPSQEIDVEGDDIYEDHHS